MNESLEIIFNELGKLIDMSIAEGGNEVELENLRLANAALSVVAEDRGYWEE